MRSSSRRCVALQLLDKGLNAGADSSDRQLATHHRDQPFSRMSDESKFSICKNTRAFRAPSSESVQQFARQRHNAVARRFALDVLVHARDRRLIGIGRFMETCASPRHAYSHPFT